MDNIRTSDTRVQRVATRSGQSRITLAQLRALVAATQHWSGETLLEIVESPRHGAAPTLILRRSLPATAATSPITEEN